MQRLHAVPSLQKAREIKEKQAVQHLQHAALREKGLLLRRTWLDLLDSAVPFADSMRRIVLGAAHTDAVVARIGSELEPGPGS